MPVPPDGVVIFADAKPIAISDNGNSTLILRNVLREACSVFGPLIPTGNSGPKYGKGRRVVYVTTPDKYVANKQCLLVVGLLKGHPNGLTLQEMVRALGHLSRHTVREYVFRCLQAQAIVAKENTVEAQRPGPKGRRYFVAKGIS